MSHEIEMIDDVASMAYVGETPWHGLGKLVPADLSPEQMLEAANLNWTVETVPAYVDIPQIVADGFLCFILLP